MMSELVVDIEEEIFLNTPIADHKVLVLRCIVKNESKLLVAAPRLLGPVHDARNSSREVSRYEEHEKLRVQPRGYSFNVNALTRDGVVKYLTTNRVLRNKFPDYQHWIETFLLPFLQQPEPVPLDCFDLNTVWHDSARSPKLSLPSSNKLFKV